MDSVDFEVDPQGNSYWLCNFHPGVFANGALTITQNESRILKYDAQGNYTGSVVVNIQASGTEKTIHMYRNHNNGNFYFSGQVYQSSSESVSIANEVLTVCKYVAAFDGNGTFLWKKTNNDNNYFSQGNDGFLTFDENNNIYVSGQAIDGYSANPVGTFAGITFIGLPQGSGYTLPYIVKLDANGNVLSFTNGSKCNVTDIYYKNGKISLGGLVKYMDWQNISITSDMSSNRKPTLLQFEAATLNILSANQMTTVSGNNDLPTALVTDSNNNIYMGGYFDGTLTAGNTTVTNNPFGSSDFYIAKFGTSNCALGVETPVFKDLNVYPNPVQSQLYIDNEEAMQYELYNVLGKKIQSGSLAVHGQLDCSGLSSGMYLLKLQNEKGEIKVVKVNRL
jgi:hypothetical protein